MHLYSRSICWTKDCVLPTDRAMHELEKYELLPCTKKVYWDTDILYSQMKLDGLVCQLVCDNNDPCMNNLEIIIGSDHGQGAFHSPIKLVFLYTDKNEKHQSRHGLTSLNVPQNCMKSFSRCLWL